MSPIKIKEAVSSQSWSEPRRLCTEIRPSAGLPAYGSNIGSAFTRHQARSQDADEKGCPCCSEEPRACLSGKMADISHSSFLLFSLWSSCPHLPCARAVGPSQIAPTPWCPSHTDECFQCARSVPSWSSISFCSLHPHTFPAPWTQI